MAVDAFMTFKPYGKPEMSAESQVDFGKNSSDEIGKPIVSHAGKVFEIDTYSFDIEQVLNIGSQSTGSGAGKVVFNPFSITRKSDLASPMLFQMACSGTPFEKVRLGLRKASGGETSGVFFLRFDFKLVAIKSIKWNHGDEAPTEDVEFEYGGLQVHYAQQNADGSMKVITPGGWNKVKNIADISDDVIK